MSFFPDGFDFTSPTALVFELVNINTSEGDFGFLLGSDGVFTDATGKDWIGSTLFSGEAPGVGLGGVAEAASLSISYADDPENPAEVIDKLRDLGSAYVAGRPVTYFLQCFDYEAQLYAPRYAPIQTATQIARHLSFDAPSAFERSVTLHMESEFAVRGQAKRLVYNTASHARQLGAANPSYEFIPTEARTERSLLG